jgi:hypothetical protein
MREHSGSQGQYTQSDRAWTRTVRSHGDNQCGNAALRLTHGSPEIDFALEAESFKEPSTPVLGTAPSN